jgi:hypothetical protein
LLSDLLEEQNKKGKKIGTTGGKSNQLMDESQENGTVNYKALEASVAPDVQSMISK